MSLEARLYYVAWFKLESPQHLVAGPFVDEEAALVAIETLPEAPMYYGVVAGPTFTVEEKARDPRRARAAHCGFRPTKDTGSVL